jgi:receptor-type tyrosine-protein phosphatase U
MTKATINYRQEKTHMMSAVDRSFTDQSTLQEDERLGLSFMDTPSYSPRGECHLPTLGSPPEPTHS